MNHSCYQKQHGGEMLLYAGRTRAARGGRSNVMFEPNFEGCVICIILSLTSDPPNYPRDSTPLRPVYLPSDQHSWRILARGSFRAPAQSRRRSTMSADILECLGPRSATWTSTYPPSLSPSLSSSPQPRAKDESSDEKK